MLLSSIMINVLRIVCIKVGTLWVADWSQSCLPDTKSVISACGWAGRCLVRAMPVATWAALAPYYRQISVVTLRPTWSSCRLIKADEQTITAEQTDIMCAFKLNYVDISTGIDIYSTCRFRHQQAARNTVYIFYKLRFIWETLNWYNYTSIECITFSEHLEKKQKMK